MDKFNEIKISFVACTVDLVGQGHSTTIYILTISVSESTVHVTELTPISLNLPTLKPGKQKIIIFLHPLMTGIGMVSIVVKRP